MKKIISIALILATLISCETTEDKVIKLIKAAKSENDLFNTTWGDFANTSQLENPNTKYHWDVKETPSEDIYLAGFSDEEEWGYRWEVSLISNTVQLINGNEYLNRKYGMSRLDAYHNFTVTGIKLDTLKIGSERFGYMWDYKWRKGLIYTFEASVMNNTDKTITDADINGVFKLIFKEKTVECEDNRRSGFKSKISKSKPWKPGTERKIHIKTKALEDVYLDYVPEHVLFELNLEASDPVGYEYDKGIFEVDLSSEFEQFKP